MRAAILVMTGACRNTTHTGRFLGRSVCPHCGQCDLIAVASVSVLWSVRTYTCRRFFWLSGHSGCS